MLDYILRFHSSFTVSGHPISSVQILNKKMSDKILDLMKFDG